MPHCNTIFAQILRLVPRHEFETLAKQHHAGRKFRKASRWSQYTCLVMAQLTGRCSLRDIVENTSSQVHRLYHLGCSKLSRSNLSRMNEDKPYELYEAFFGRLLRRCQRKAIVTTSTWGSCCNFPKAALSRWIGATMITVGIRN